MKTLYLRQGMNVRDFAKQVYYVLCDLATQGKDFKLTISIAESKRTLEQNAKMWAMLEDVAKQEQMLINGNLEYTTPEDWKDWFTALLQVEEKQSLRVAFLPGGQFVVLGLRTSRMTIKRMTKLIEVMDWYAAENDIVWTEKPNYLERYAA